MGWWERHIAWLFLAPALLLLLGLVAYPTVLTWRFAFSRVEFVLRGLSLRPIGLGNFARAFDDPLVRQSAWITLEWVVVVTLVELVLGLGIALLMTQRIRYRGLITSILIIPIVLPPVSVAVAWLFMYEPSFGIINHLLGQLGFPPLRWLANADLALNSIMLVDIWQATPFVFLLVYAGLLSLPTEPFEAAAIDGASGWQVFRDMTLPLLRPTLLVVLLLRTIDAARIFDKMFVMTRGGPGTATQTMILTVYKTGFIHFDFGYAAALSLLFQIVLIVLATLYIRRILGTHA